jgi:hypothetical protein
MRSDQSHLPRVSGRADSPAAAGGCGVRRVRN